jgi:hypothetical protein
MSEPGWVALHTEKNDPVDSPEPEDYVSPDELEDGPDEDYPDDDAEIN